jgi:hypothetical protein
MTCEEKECCDFIDFSVEGIGDFRIFFSTKESPEVVNKNSGDAIVILNLFLLHHSFSIKRGEIYCELSQDDIYAIDENSSVMILRALCASLGVECASGSIDVDALGKLKEKMNHDFLNIDSFSGDGIGATMDDTSRNDRIKDAIKSISADLMVGKSCIDDELYKKFVKHNDSMSAARALYEVQKNNPLKSIADQFKEFSQVSAFDEINKKHKDALRLSGLDRDLSALSGSSKEMFKDFCGSSLLSKQFEEMKKTALQSQIPHDLSEKFDINPLNIATMVPSGIEKAFEESNNSFLRIHEDIANRARIHQIAAESTASMPAMLERMNDVLVQIDSNLVKINVHNESTNEETYKNRRIADKQFWAIFIVSALACAASVASCLKAP